MSRASSILPSQIRDAVPLFAALGDETRMRLLIRLSERGPESISGLSAGSAVSRQAVTKHLLVLANAGLVQDTRRGRERIWALEPDRFDDAHQYLERISRLWDQALDRLKTFVETSSDDSASARTGKLSPGGRESL